MRRYHLPKAVPLFFTLLSILVVDIFFSPGIPGYLAILLIFVGLFFWWWGMINLGDAFAAMPKAKKLVTTGAYSKLRNPIYLGLSLALFGWSLMIGYWWLWLIAVLVTLSSIIRARMESKVLEKKFGQKYRNYRKKTWF